MVIITVSSPNEIPVRKQIKPVRIEIQYNAIDKRKDTIYYYNKKIK